MDVEPVAEPAERRAGRRRALLVGALIVVPVAIILFGWLATRPVCKPLPYIYAYEEDGEIFRPTLPDFRLTAEDGRPFTQDSLRGQYHIANFIFTTCPGICPDLSRRMAEVQGKLRDARAQGVRIVSYTVDPQTDTPAALTEYAKRYNADPRYWTFLTGEDSVLLNVIKAGYKVPILQTPDGKEKVTHSNLALLVDKELRVRGFYEVINGEKGDAEVKRLLDEINVLACEYRNR